jgi:hypothetical protein
MIGTEVNAETRGEPGDVPEAVMRAIMDAADAGFAKSQEEVAENSTDTGQLLKSGEPPERVDDAAVVWGYKAPYAPYVEYGTAPHYPPIEPLKRWASRVLGDESIAYALQKKIGEEGTEPQPFVRPGIEAMKRRLRREGISPYIEEEL